MGDHIVSCFLTSEIRLVSSAGSSLHIFAIRCLALSDRRASENLMVYCHFPSDEIHCVCFIPPLDKQGITSMDKDRMTFSQVNLLLNMGVSMVPQ